MKREDWEATFCKGKVSFDTWRQAEDVRRARHRGSRKQARQVYRCAFCGLFHLGTPNRKRGRPQPE